MAGKAAGPVPTALLPHMQAQMHTHTAALTHAYNLGPAIRGKTVEEQEGLNGSLDPGVPTLAPQSPGL